MDLNIFYTIPQLSKDLSSKNHNEALLCVSTINTLSNAKFYFFHLIYNYFGHQ
jgi:hypothetical protein